MPDVNLEYILNKLTMDSYRRLLGASISGKKEDIKKKIIEKMDDPRFRKKFENFYRQIEFGGKKHFFIRRFELKDEEKIKDAIEEIKEIDRSYFRILIKKIKKVRKREENAYIAFIDIANSTLNKKTFHNI